MKHIQACPKDENLRKIYPLITPEQAQSLYSDTIKSKWDFICATEGCEAPLTCCLIDKPEATPYFVEQSRKENLHKSFCDFSNREKKQAISLDNSDTEFSVEFSGHYTGNSPRDIFNQGLGDSFLPSFIPQTITTENDLNNEKNHSTTSGKRSRSTNSKPHEKKIYNKRISDIFTAVYLFESNPDLIISDWFLGKNIPIKNYFKPIYQNHLQSKFYDSVPIFFGNGFIVDTVKSDYLFNFGKFVSIDGKDFRPHFFVDKNFINQCFPFLKKRVENNPKKTF